MLGLWMEFQHRVSKGLFLNFHRQFAKKLDSKSDSISARQAEYADKRDA
jgi:hypothetical protein